ncbi:MAG: hypothetical protein M3256_12925 [Actinomycetota bacterium]|nr:hypothetical protein [Actinomycetota bacterium]
MSRITNFAGSGVTGQGLLAPLLRSAERQGRGVAGPAAEADYATGVGMSSTEEVPDRTGAAGY